MSNFRVHKFTKKVRDRHSGVPRLAGVVQRQDFGDDVKTSLLVGSGTTNSPVLALSAQAQTDTAPFYPKMQREAEEDKRAIKNKHICSMLNKRRLFSHSI